VSAARKNIMLGTAGHVDHGKTALVKLLTGCETDTLAEEKQRGLTIDLGFAPCRLADDRIVGIVDVPGHVDFIRNMVAGAHGVDVVMLVVAADDGIMPQTQEHLHILTLMGLRHGLVALTKIDLVEAARRVEVERELRRLLAGTFLETAPICPLSNVTGEGFGLFFDTLNQVAGACDARPAQGVFRMWVEDVFTIRGSGTVVTGIPSGGTVRAGDAVCVLPAGAAGRVRRMQVYGEDAPEGRPGECVALNVPELDHTAIRRGMMLCEPDALVPVALAEAELRLLPTLRDPLPDYVEVQVHVGTASVVGRVAMLERPGMRPGEGQCVQLRLREPLALTPGDRFVVRANVASDQAGITTVGGGRVLGVDNVRLRRQKAWTLQQLAERREVLDDPEGWVELMVRQAAAPLVERDLQARSRLRLPELRAVLEQRRIAGALRRTATGAWVHAQVVAAAAEAMVQHLAAFHEQHADRPGMEPEELRGKADVGAEVFALAVDDLVRAGRVAKMGAVLARAGWTPKGSSREETLRAQVAAAFLSAGWVPPTTVELAPALRVPPASVDQAIRFLVQNGLLVRLDDRITMHRDAVEKARATALQLFAQKPRFTTMEFRDALAVSRKYAVPLLDYLDRTRFTVRSGHDRTAGVEARPRLNPPPAGPKP
jgi:selenocysteine-specific elongation factor